MNLLVVVRGRLPAGFEQLPGAESAISGLDFNYSRIHRWIDLFRRRSAGACRPAAIRPGATSGVTFTSGFIPVNDDIATRVDNHLNDASGCFRRLPFADFFHRLGDQRLRHLLRINMADDVIDYQFQETNFN